MPYCSRIIATSAAFVLLFVGRAIAQTGDPQPGLLNQSLPGDLTAQAEQESSPVQSAQPRGQQSQLESTPTEAQDSKSAKNANGTSHDRLFFALPNYLTLENAGQVPPLTTGQKFKVVTRGSFDYVNLPWYALIAGISQARDSDSGFGEGASGYGKRYAATFADGTIENYFASAIFPSILHQDPRFFQTEKGGFWRRVGYAVSRIIITRSDAGNNQFNYSEIFGAGVAAGISTYSYHPTKTLANTESVWVTQVGFDALKDVLKEFWPDIRRKVHKDK